MATVRPTANKADSRVAAKDAMVLIIDKTTVETNLKKVQFNSVVKIYK